MSKSSSTGTKNIIAAIIIVLLEAFLMSYCMRFFSINAPFINSLCFVLAIHLIIFILKFLHIIKA